MILGKAKFIFFLLTLNLFATLFAEEKTITTPIINLENLKPSFEKEDAEQNDTLKSENTSLKEKKINETGTKKIRINIVALDKITAKTSDINILLGETKKFGLLEIKALQCGEIESITEPGYAAYIQVKDLSDNKNNQVFVFNGWTFSSSTTLRPLDHSVYDLWLVGCDNV